MAIYRNQTGTVTNEQVSRFYKDVINGLQSTPKQLQSKYFYDAEVDDYANRSDKEATFVRRVEALISLENSIWVSVHQPKPEQQDKKAG